MTEKSSKNSKNAKPRTRKMSAKKAVLRPATERGVVMAGALILLRDNLDREACQCDDQTAAGVCPLCAVKACSGGRDELAAAVLADVANVVEDEDFTADDAIEVRSALIHWIESASDEEVDEVFVEAIQIAEAR